MGGRARAMLFATICANMKSENFFILSQIQILSQIATSRNDGSFRHSLFSNSWPTASNSSEILDSSVWSSNSEPMIFYGIPLNSPA